MNNNDLDPELLQNIPILDHLSRNEALTILSSSCTDVVELPAQHLIFREGEIGDFMYIVLSGEIELYLSISGGFSAGISLAKIKKHGFFGEQSLLPGSDNKRSASAMTKSDTRLLKISKRMLLSALKSRVQTNTIDGIIVSPILTDEEELDVIDILDNTRMFKSMGIYEKSSYQQWCEILKVSAGTLIFREGVYAKHFYVVIRGVVEIFTIDDDGKIAMLAKISRGRYFGEQAIMPGVNVKRSANVRADREVLLLKISKTQFHHILSQDKALESALCVVGQKQKESKLEITSNK